jgi:hypothetical protein
MESDIQVAEIRIEEGIGRGERGVSRRERGQLLEDGLDLDFQLSLAIHTAVIEKYFRLGRSPLAR